MKIIMLAQKSFVKIIASLSLAFLTVLFLFYIMSVLISNTPDIKKQTKKTGVIEFLRVKPRQFLDEKKRKLPQKKQKEMKPPKMKMLPSALPKPQKMNQKMNLPDIKSILKSGGPAVGGLGMAMGSGIQPLIRIEPVYPRKAAMQKIEGWVMLQFNITPAGTLSDIQVLNAKPPRIFNRSAIKALRKWRYQPKIENGKPVEQTGVKVILDFTLQ